MGKTKIKDIVTYSNPPKFDYETYKSKIRKNGKELYQRIENEIEYISMINEISDPTIWEKAWLIIKNAPKIINLIYLIIKVKNNMKDNIKTTIASIVQGVVLILGIFGVSVAPELQAEIISVAGGLYAIIGMIKGYFTKDKDPEAKD